MADIKKGVILVLVLVAIVAAIVLIQQPFKEVQEAEQDQVVPAGVGKKVGDLAIDLEFETTTGERIKLSDFKGKSALVVNSWAGWCPFCIDEMPDLQRVSNKYDDLTVIFVHRTRTESKDIARTYLGAFPEERGIAITDPVAWDTEDNFYKTYFGFGMPVTVFIDKNGVIQDRKIGPLTLGEIEEKFKGLVE